MHVQDKSSAGAQCTRSRGPNSRHTANYRPQVHPCPPGLRTQPPGPPPSRRRRQPTRTWCIGHLTLPFARLLFAPDFHSRGANQLVSWKLFQARPPPWGVWRTGGSTDTWKTLLKFYSVNCLVFHVGQRSRSRCIRTIIRENGGIGIEVATLS